MAYNNSYHQNAPYAYPGPAQQSPYLATHSQVPQSPQPSPEVFLRGAFPNVDPSTIGAILASTRGEVEPAYNALLAISNPKAPSSGGLQHTPQPPVSQAQSFYHSSPAPPPTQPSLNHYASSPAYLQPQEPPPQYYAASSYPAARPQTTSVAPPASPHPVPSPNLHPTLSAPPQYIGSNSAPSLPDMSQLNLNDTGPVGKNGESRHWASCDGCGKYPIYGVRWNCVKCADYDLCAECRDAGVHQNHLMEQIPALYEVQSGFECDGCKIAGKSILGPRYKCQQHTDEDFCVRCIKTGKACPGPFTIIRQTEMGQRLERERCVPIPASWSGKMGPAIATYNLESSGISKWLMQQVEMTWFDKPQRERVKVPSNPVYRIEVKNTKGHFMSDHKYSWVIKNKDDVKLYTYTLERDRKTNTVRSEKFGEYKGKSFTPVWRHGPQVDSLTFEDPKTGQQYRWVTNRPVSTLNHERFDYQRYALFHTRSGKEMIVADYTWWDADFEPEDLLTIRDSRIDHAMVMASLIIIQDHQWTIMMEEAERDPQNYNETEQTARLTRLGCASHWYLSDFGSAGGGGQSSGSRYAQVNAAISLASNVVDVVNSASSLGACDSGGGGGGGGGDCSGGGGGGC